jgi:hypothetical protein
VNKEIRFKMMVCSKTDFDKLQELTSKSCFPLVVTETLVQVVLCIYSLYVDGEDGLSLQN